MKWHPIIGKL